MGVGRDRQWTLFDTKTWTLKRVCAKAHARILWDVSFLPLEFGRVFVTASRDKCVKIWTTEGECIATVKFPEAVTACTCLPEMVGNMAFVAVGLENGRMFILGCDKGSTQWKVVHTFDERYVGFERR